MSVKPSPGVVRSGQPLERLFRSAAGAPERVPAEVAFALEARVLALMRSGSGFERVEAEWGHLFSLLRGALALGCLALALAVGMGWRTSQSDTPETLALRDSTAITLSMLR